jgi:hypothetical protein
MLFVITFAFIALAMAAMALKLMLGCADGLRRGCATTCDCVKPASQHIAGSSGRNRRARSS